MGAITRDEAAPGGKNISRNWRSGCANANSRASKPRARFRERRGKSQKRTRDYERSYHSKALGRTAFNTLGRRLRCNTLHPAVARPQKLVLVTEYRIIRASYLRKWGGTLAQHGILRAKTPGYSKISHFLCRISHILPC